MGRLLAFSFGGQVVVVLDLLLFLGQLGRFDLFLLLFLLGLDLKEHLLDLIVHLVCETLDCLVMADGPQQRCDRRFLVACFGHGLLRLRGRFEREVCLEGRLQEVEVDGLAVGVEGLSGLIFLETSVSNVFGRF